MQLCITTCTTLCNLHKTIVFIPNKYVGGEKIVFVYVASFEIALVVFNIEKKICYLKPFISIIRSILQINIYSTEYQINGQAFRPIILSNGN